MAGVERQDDRPRPPVPDLEERRAAEVGGDAKGLLPILWNIGLYTFVTGKVYPTVASKLGHSLWLKFGGRKRLGRDLRQVAADDRDVAMALTLIGMGAEVDDKDPETGRTPLMVAVDFECRSIVVALLSHGADIHIKANNGKSALDIARDKNLTEIATLLQETHQVNQSYKPK